MNTTNQTIETVQTDTLRAEASAFIARLVAAGTAWSDLNEDDYAEAVRHGFMINQPNWGRGKPLPDAPTYADIRRCW